MAMPPNYVAVRVDNKIHHVLPHVKDDIARLLQPYSEFTEPVKEVVKVEATIEKEEPTKTSRKPKGR